MILDFYAQSYEQPSMGLPAARLRNMYPQATPGGPYKSARVQRPGLQLAYSLGSSGIRGLFQRSGAFNEDVFAVAGTELYRGTTLIGTVALGAVVRWAASYTQLVIAVGGVAYCYNGDTLQAITIPDSLAVSDVFVLGSRFFYVIEGSDEWFFSDLDDATSINSLSFETADAQPDASVGAGVLGDRAVFFGEDSVEFWSATGDPDAPLVRQSGSTYSKGCVSQASIVYADNRFFWVGSDKKIYTIGAPLRVSDHAFEEHIRQCMSPSTIAGFPATWNGNDFVVFNVPGEGSWALHIESGEPLEWTSHERTTFRCACSTIAGATTYLGDADTGNVYVLADVFTDDGDPIERIASVLAPAGTINRLILDAAAGVGLEDGSDAIVEARYSKDYRTFTSWRPKSLGLIGDYDKRPRWGNLGFSRRPRVVEFRCTDPVRATFAGVRINEP